MDVKRFYDMAAALRRSMDESSLDMESRLMATRYWHRWMNLSGGFCLKRKKTNLHLELIETLWCGVFWYE